MDDKAINKHYGISGILNSILDALESSGKDLHSLEPNDLSPTSTKTTTEKIITIKITMARIVLPEATLN